MHVSEDDFRHYLLGQFGAEADQIQSHLSECSACASKSRDVARSYGLSPDDRRRDHRFRVDDPVLVQNIDPVSDVVLAGRILDLSRSGLQLSLPVMALPGTLMKLRLSKCFVFAEVRRCTQVGNEFRIGLSIQQVLGTR
jgi:hypothetical protein